MLKWVFGGKRKSKSGPPPDYARAKEISATGGVEARRELAAHEDLQPEFLYYFATDEVPEIRRVVAANSGTPLQADVILSKDSDEAVRCALGHKIGALLPDLSAAEGDKVRDMVFEILDVLAGDQMARVRAVIAEEIKRLDNVPPRIVKMLAEDAEAIVAAPIVQYSPLLSNADLLEILTEGLNEETLIALARRKNLDEAVADAVVDTDASPAIGALLENKSASIGAAAMEKIVDRAGPRADLHEPLVFRGGMSESLIRRIAEFVGASLLDPLIKRNALVDEGMAKQLRRSVEKRLKETGSPEGETEQVPEDNRPDFVEDVDPELERAKKLHGDGALTHDILRDALARGDAGFLGHALGLVAEIPAHSIKKTFDTKSAKSAMAIAWHCGLGVEFAVALQRDLWRVEDEGILESGPDGGYPMSDSDLEWSYGLLRD